MSLPEPTPDPPAAPAAGPPSASTPAAASAPRTSAAPGPRLTPWVQLKYFSFAPHLYPAMIKAASPDARPGHLVTVYDKTGQRFGHGWYNPRARVPLRMVHHGDTAFGEADLLASLERALSLRLDTLRLPEVTDAFRVVHSDGDALSGLAIDRYADVLSVEVHSLGVHQRLPQWLPRLHARLGTRRTRLEVDPHIARFEGIRPTPPAEPPPRSVKVREHGVRYEVDFEEGHKTGFFCDQRENRLQFARWLAPEARVLDLCCYTGGFALAAAVLGRCTDVTGVDLDERAIAQARRNANLNAARIQWVHCDAFSYARQMQRNGTLWDAVVLDPPKLIESRETYLEGQRKYDDLNRLAVTLVRPGGLFVTCSCSGLVSPTTFEEMVVHAVHRQARRLQFLDATGAGPDHPVLSNCAESRYLKVLWARVM